MHGTTSQEIIQMAKDVGAKKVALLFHFFSLIPLYFWLTSHWQISISTMPWAQAGMTTPPHYACTHARSHHIQVWQARPRAGPLLAHPSAAGLCAHSLYAWIACPICLVRRGASGGWWKATPSAMPMPTPTQMPWTWGIQVTIDLVVIWTPSRWTLPLLLPLPQRGPR